MIRSDGTNEEEINTHLPLVTTLYSFSYSFTSLQDALSSPMLPSHLLKFTTLAELTFPVLCREAMKLHLGCIQTQMIHLGLNPK